MKLRVVHAHKELDVRAVAVEVLRLLLQLASPVFSTRAGEAPPGYSRDAWRDVARAIGVKRGRYHYVSQAQLDAHEHRSIALSPAPFATKWTPAQAAEALDLRIVGGGRR